jgi:hypothetical protein
VSQTNRSLGPLRLALRAQPRSVKCASKVEVEAPMNLRFVAAEVTRRILANPNHFRLFTSAATV